MQRDFWVKDGIWGKVAAQKNFWVKNGALGENEKPNPRGGGQLLNPKSSILC